HDCRRKAPPFRPMSRKPEVSALMLAAIKFSINQNLLLQSANSRVRLRKFPETSLELQARRLCEMIVSRRLKCLVASSAGKEPGISRIRGFSLVELLVA